MVSQVERFTELGFSGKDVRHIGVHVQPVAEISGGEVSESFKIFIGNDEGNFDIDFPTDLVFASMTPGWVFESFNLGGRTWEGIAMIPDDGDFQISFGDIAQNSVVVIDVPTQFFTHRYQMVMRNTDTGQVIATDPSVKNGDRQGVGP